MTEKLPVESKAKRRPQKVSNAEIVEALTVNHGLISRACEWLKTEKGISVTPSAIRQRCGNSPQLQSVLDDERARIVDVAESRLFEKVEAGEPWAIQLVLKTLGQSRGYNEKFIIEAMKKAFRCGRAYTFIDGSTTNDRQRVGFSDSLSDLL